MNIWDKMMMTYSEFEVKSREDALKIVSGQEVELKYVD